MPKCLKRIIGILFCIPRSFLFCLQKLPLVQALKCPILLSNQTVLNNISGKIVIRGESRFGLIRIGFGNVGIFDRKYSRTILENAGTIYFNGSAAIGHGSKISVFENGVLSFGDNFSNTAEMSLICCSSIRFGKSVLVSWNVLRMDNDFHETFSVESGGYNSVKKPIVIGNRCWIGTRVCILKGTELPDECIIGACSVLNKKYDVKPYSVLAGNPAVLKKTGIVRS